MKALLIFAAVAGTAFVGYSYNATDGKSCLVCPMTGEAVFGSSESESDAGSCCAGGTEAMLTGIAGEGSSCCSKGAAETMLTSVESKTAACCSPAASGCCSKDSAEAMLTSTDAAECHGNCEKGCCKDKTDSVDVAASQDETVSEEVVAEEVVAEATESE